jgi:hypothetical protein
LNEGGGRKEYHTCVLCSSNRVISADFRDIFDVPHNYVACFVLSTPQAADPTGYASMDDSIVDNIPFARFDTTKYSESSTIPQIIGDVVSKERAERWQRESLRTEEAKGNFQFFLLVRLKRKLVGKLGVLTLEEVNSVCNLQQLRFVEGESPVILGKDITIPSHPVHNCLWKSWW